MVIDGRRWRATDPAIPPNLGHELVAVLMAARRAVGAARRAGDPDAEAAAHAEVHDAKVALGERGERWWEAGTADGRRRRIVATVMTLLRHRRPDSSICPSDAARAAGGASWRTLVPSVREIADALAGDGIVEVTQGGRPTRAVSAKGPVRIRRGPRFDQPGAPTCSEPR